MISVRANQSDMALIAEKFNSMPEEVFAMVSVAILSLKEYIENALVQAFPTHSNSHFSVNITTDSSEVYIIDIEADEIGKFIYYGTSAHTIATADGGAMPIQTDSGLFFATSVSHPGQESKKEIIDEIVEIGLDNMWKGYLLWGF